MEESLYDKYGGFSTLSKVVHEFYRRVLENDLFAEAQAKLFRILQKNPRDKVAWHHLMKATECLDNGIPENWTGVTVMASK